MEVIRSLFFPISSIFIITLASNFNSLEGTFHYDDDHSIVKNFHLTSPDIFSRLWYDTNTFSGEVGIRMYRPLVVLSYAVTKLIYGLNPYMYLLTNILIHAFVAVIVFLFISRWFSSNSIGWTTAIIFAIHPINSQVANYISSRSESMATMGVLLFIVFLQGGKTGFGIVSLIFGLLSKSQAILSLPLYFLVFKRDVFSRNRLSAGFLLVVFSSIYLIILSFSGFLSSSFAQDVRPLTIQIYTQIKALVYYIYLFVCPVYLSVEHAFIESGSLTSASTMFGLLFLIFLSITFIKNAILLKKGLLFFFVSMLITFIIPLNMLINEHRVYMASIGLIVCTVFCLRSKAIIKPFIITYIIILSLLSWQRNIVWKEDYSLWNEAVSLAPNSFRALSNFGLAELNSGRLNSSVNTLTKAIKINPNYARTWNNLGLAYGQLGKPEKAREAFERAIEIDPVNTGYFANLGNLFISLRQYGNAVKTLNSGLKVDSLSVILHTNLGIAHQKAGRIQMAASHYHYALRSEQSNIDILNNLGLIEQELGRNNEAKSYYLSALKLQPSDFTSRINLALLQGKENGQTDIEIIEGLIANYAFEPNLWRILASEYAKMGEYDRAIIACEKVLGLSPDDEQAAVHKDYLIELLNNSRD